MTPLRSYATSIPSLVALLMSLIAAQIGSPGVALAATPMTAAPTPSQSLSRAPSPSPSPTSPTAPTPTPTRAHTPQATHEIVFIGDSLTAGFFATAQARDYVSLTAARTHKTFLVEGEYGVSAVVTNQQMQVGAPRLRVNAVPDDARYVVIELGTNDVVAPGETLTQFKSSYDAILTRVQRDAPNARLICLGTWRNPNAGAHESGYAYNKVIRAECPGSYVPLGDLFVKPALRGPAGRATWMGRSDDFHPNDAGHAAIAARVVAAIG